MPLKVLHVLAYAVRGGCEKNCYHFIGATPDFEHQVVVLGKEGPMVHEWKNLGVPVAVTDILHLNLFSFTLQLKSRLPSGNFDKVIVWTNIRMPVMLHVLNKYAGAQLYVHFGNPISSSFMGTVKNKVLQTVLPVKNQTGLRAVSAFVQRRIFKDPYFRMFPSKVSLKPIPVPDFSVEKPVLLAEDAVIAIGMIARLDKIKDHETVIRAFKIVHQQYVNARLYLGGEGSERSALEKQVYELGLTNAVIFTGEVANVFEVMRKWHLFVYATTLKEGLGGTVPEALAVGLPVVATDLPMIREWDEEGKLISYCRPQDPSDMAERIVQLLKAVDQRMRCYTEGRNYIVHHYSPRQFALNYIS